MTTIELILIAIVVLYYSILTIMNYRANKRTLDDITLQMNNLHKTVDKIYEDVQNIQSDVRKVEINTQKILDHTYDNDDNVAICTK